MGSSNIHVTSPDAYLMVFPYKFEKTVIGRKYDSSSLEVKKILITKDILSISTSKGKGAAGTWHVSLASSKNYKARLHVGCWIMIYIDDQPFETYKDGSSSKSGLKMLGVIRSVRCIESTAGNGVRSIRYEISGDDFQSLFQTEVYFNSMILSKESKVTPNVRNQVIFGQKVDGTNPTDMITLALDRFFTRTAEESSALSDTKGSAQNLAGGTVVVPSEVSKRLGVTGNLFNSIIKRDLHKTPGNFITMSSPSDRFSVWSLLKSLSNPALNEIYTDLSDDGKTLKPTITLRPLPFSVNTTHPNTLKIKDVKTSKKIEEHEILSLNYGKSDAERFNMFMVYPSNNPGGMVTTMTAISQSLSDLFDANSVARFGLRPFITTTDYSLGMNEVTVRTNDVARDMWSNAHLYENGQVTIVGSHQYIPVGSNIEFKERGWVAHVEAVSNHYHVSGEGHKGYFTTISFVRLQTKDGEPIDMIEKGKRETDPGVTHSEGGEDDEV